MRPSVIQSASLAPQIELKPLAIGERLPLVEVVGPAEKFAGLDALIAELGYRTRSSSKAPDLIAEIDHDAPDAVIVLDESGDALPLCSAWAQVCPVILVSSQDGFAFRLAAAAAKVRAVVRPPISPIEMSDWLDSICGSTAADRTSVVIVDDDWLTATVNAEILRSAGMEVTTVCDPRTALAEIERLLPDMVLMDMEMPGVDGITLAQIIRQTRQFLAMPIVFLSGEQDESRQLEARQLGGDDFITKPVNPGRLISLVQLRTHRARLLRTMIERDGLTGLYDHTRFNERLAHELERSRRIDGPLSLVMIDLDRFKMVNDQYGHPVGDTVIRALAHSLRAGLRKIDIVGRYGGEEFGVIMLDTDAQAAYAVINRIRAQFSQIAFRAASTSFTVTFSAGIAATGALKEFPEIVAAADQALYQAKAAGRDTIKLFEFQVNDSQPMRRGLCQTRPAHARSPGERRWSARA